MVVDFRSRDTGFSTPVTLVTTAETIVVTSLPISTTDPNQQVSLFSFITVTGGTGTTGMIMRVRRGTTLSGTVIGPQDTVTLSGTNTVNREIGVTDTPGEVAGQQYVITCQLVGATANGSVIDGGVSVRYPTG